MNGTGSRHTETSQFVRDTRSVLQLPPACQREIERAALASHPHEACGLLIGSRDVGSTRVVEARACPNIERERPHDRYELDPIAHIAVEREARERGLEVVGVWHSHPERSAIPSAVDRDAAWEGWSYVIAATRADRVVDVRSWTLRDGAFVEERVV